MRHALAAAAFLAAVLFLCPGCGRRHGGRPDLGDGIELLWIRPAAADSIVADTIRCELSITGRNPERVVLLADGAEVAKREFPPWRFQWLPNGDRPGKTRIEAIAGEAHAPVRIIRWDPDLPPEVRILGIPSGGGIRRADAESVRASAADPEDGAVESGSIIWSSDRQGLIGFGGRIPTVSLVPGRHRLQVRAADRWKRSATAIRWIEAFDPPDPAAGPASAIDGIRLAAISADSAGYMLSIDSTFRFLCCPAERDSDRSLPAEWTREDEPAFASRLRRIGRFEWRTAFLQPFRSGGEDWAKAEMMDLSVDFVPEAGDTLRVRGGKARLYIRKQQGAEVWQLQQWQDLGAAGPLSYGRLRAQIMKGSL